MFYFFLSRFAHIQFVFHIFKDSIPSTTTISTIQWLQIISDYHWRFPQMLKFYNQKISQQSVRLFLIIFLVNVLDPQTSSLIVSNFSLIMDYNIFISNIKFFSAIKTWVIVPLKSSYNISITSSLPFYLPVENFCCFLFLQAVIMSFCHGYARLVSVS